MPLYSGASALALLATLSQVYGQGQLDLNQDCNHLAQWAVCTNAKDTRFHCATIRVPRDWTNPQPGDEIDLRLIRYAVSADVATANLAESIIVNNVRLPAIMLAGNRSTNAQ